MHLGKGVIVDARKFSDALNLLDAMSCTLHADNSLTWLETNRLEVFAFRELPKTLAELEARLGLNRIARENGFADQNLIIAKNDDYEIRCNLENRHLTIQKLCKFGMSNRELDVQAIALSKALIENRICLYRQPIVAANDQTVVRFECLARMVREDGTIAAPYEFIPAAERAGLISNLDLAALNLALLSLRGQSELNLAVNVSAATIADPSARQEFEETLRFHAKEANNLTVEITETIAIQDIDIAAKFATNIKASNARVALDDFGAGYSSFRSLQIIPLDEVKIDGLFVENINERGDSRAFVRAIDALSRDLGLETIAERVETEAEANMLREIGVFGLQGYLYGRPIAV